MEFSSVEPLGSQQISDTITDPISDPQNSYPTDEGDEYVSKESNDHQESQKVVNGADKYTSIPPTMLFSDLNTWYKKRYIGGFRHKHTGTEYFHASSQTPTPQELKAAQSGPKFHRDCQTKFTRHRKTQAVREKFTQMYAVSGEDDYMLRCGRYVSAEEWHQIVVKKVTIIQCFVRRCFAKRLLKHLKQEKRHRLKAVAEKERRRREFANKKRKKEIESRLHPKTGKDFQILYNGLESCFFDNLDWRIQETSKINMAGYSEPARLAALADLMDQEASLIQKIDRLKIQATEENKERAITKLLERMAAPKRWPVYRGGSVLVDTPNTIRARELRDLYHALNVSLLDVDERLQILLHEFDCSLTREIVELIDREGDLVSRGRDSKSLEGLRKRISNNFLQFIQTPEFNPEAAIYQKFPDAGQSWKRDQSVYYCRGCMKYLPSTEFYLSTTLKNLGRCKPCTIKENIAHHRQEDSCYSDILKTLRAQEIVKRKKYQSGEDEHYNAMALIQESDMRYLVDVIWNKQSIISSNTNMEDLVMTRWDHHIEASPWNCILLTRMEGEKHDTQSRPEELYTDDFIRKVKQKHLAARRHFGQLPAMERYMRKHYAEAK